MPLRYSDQRIAGYSDRPTGRRPLQSFAVRLWNDGTYRTKERLWLGVGSRLTYIGTIWPYLPGVRIEVLRIGIAHLPDRVEYTTGGAAAIPHTVHGVHRALSSTD